VSDIPIAQVVHSVPGRTRIRIAERRHDAGYFETVGQRLSGYSGVSAVEANPLTGSVIVRHTNRLDALRSFAADNHLFALGPERETNSMTPSTSPAPSASALARLAPSLWATSSNFPDLRVLGFVALWGLGFMQLFRGQIAPPAVSLFWMGINLLFFRAAHTPREAATEDSMTARTRGVA
jgi:Heavy metal associated domain 2